MESGRETIDLEPQLGALAPLSERGDSPETRLDRTAEDGRGAFWRDGSGTWRYRLDDSEVAAATDLTLADLFDPPSETRDGAEMRVIPRSWASRHPDHPLAWVFEYAPLGGREAIEVPAGEWRAHADQVVAMCAPELHPHNLVGVDGVAAVAGVSEATVRAYLARDQMPPPIGRVGGSPFWSRPLIERWVLARPRQKSSSAPIEGNEPAKSGAG